MLTFDDVVGPWANHDDLTDERAANIRRRLLPACWALEQHLRMAGIVCQINPTTGTSVSGETLGGFRPQGTAIGAPRSNHKEGLAVDRYDPDGRLDAWCIANLDVLRQVGIWLEHPDATPGWAHWQVVAPKSGRQVFRP